MNFSVIDTSATGDTWYEGMVKDAANWAIMETSHPASGQFAFPATQNASSDANTLDDYEEGYYTPVISSGAGTYVLNSSYNTLAYVKIGSFTNIQGAVTITGTNGLLGGPLLFSLPFVAASLTENADASIGSVMLSSHGGTIANSIYLGVVGGSATAYLITVADNGTQSYIDDSDVDSAWDIVVNLSFRPA